MFSASLEKIKSALSSPRSILGIATLVLFFACLYPFLILFYTCFFSDSGFTWQHFQKLMESASTMRAIQNTVIVSFATALLSTFLAVPLAWLLTRTNLPHASKLRSYFCLPYAIPPYIGAIAWIHLANPSNGILNMLFGVSFFNIYNLGGLVWVMGSFFYTLVLLLALTSLDRMDASFEEAARISGASPLRVFFQVTFPLISPAILSGMLLVVLASAASFGVPAMIGNPASIFLLTTKIYTFQRMGSESALFSAAALSVILFAFAILILVANYWIQRSKNYSLVSGKTTYPSKVELGKWRYPCFYFCLAFLFLVLILPLLAILQSALSTVQGKFAWDNIGLGNFYRVFFEIEETPRALGNSFYIAFMAASFATVLGTIVAYIQHKTKVWGRDTLGILASLPYATPGTVLAFALILTFSSSVFSFSIPLYNTLGILILAYMVKFLSFSVRTTGDAFVQIDDSLGEASRVAGASWFTSIRSIWLPLMKTSLVASWFLIFMPSFSDLTITILLSGPGMETVGTLLFQLQEYADVSGGGAAVLSLLIVFAVMLTNYLVKLLSKGKYGL